MMTDSEITALVQDVEDLLRRCDVHLNTDRFNDLHDYITSLVADIRESGE